MFLNFFHTYLLAFRKFRNGNSTLRSDEGILGFLKGLAATKRARRTFFIKLWV
jgi:hypothetical protein